MRLDSLTTGAGAWRALETVKENDKKTENQKTEGANLKNDAKAGGEVSSRIASLNIAAENMKAADVKIDNLNSASNMINVIKQQISSKSEEAVAAHGNPDPKNVLNLLG